MHHTIIYREPGRFGGWPANYGIWSWGDEIVLGFTAGYYEASEQFHARDKSRPFTTMQARSEDGGRRWTVQAMPCPTPGNRALSADEHMIPELQVGNALAGENAPRPCPGDVDFTHPDFALLCARTGLGVGAQSWFYLSQDRCRSWHGPYSLPMFGLAGIAARTDYLVLGPKEALLFLTGSVPGGGEGRVFCARTGDGGKSFRFVSWVTPEPEGYTIMPASLRLASGRILTAVRCSAGRNTTTSPRCWIDLYASDDEGHSWQQRSEPVHDAGRGGNPPTLTQLQDGRLCITYGYRNSPCGIRAVLSSDEGATWNESRVLRDDAGNFDIGYPRTVQRPDGTMVTAYYYNEENQERFIAATLWRP